MPWIKPKLAAARSTLSLPTIYRYARSPEPPFLVKQIGSRLAIDEASFAAWLDAAPTRGGEPSEDSTAFRDLQVSLSLVVTNLKEIIESYDVLRAEISKIPSTYSTVPITQIVESGDRTQPLTDTQKRKITIEIARMVRHDYPMIHDGLNALL